MPIKNYTTEVSEEKTVGEIMGLLAGKGARSIRIDYDEKNRPSAISFTIAIQSLPIPFRLPCNFIGVQKAMGYGSSVSSPQEQKVRRVAWRIVKDWIAAQMALIEAQQASLAQVFLPYAVPNEKTGTTVFDQFLDQVSRQKALSEGSVQ